MLLKKKKTIMCFLLIIMTFFVFSLFSVKSVSASSDTNPQTNTNCSKYLNIMKNDYFMEEIIVSTLLFNRVYNIGANYISEYKKDSIVAPEKMAKEFIGFKCNGIFYADFVNLKKSGTYIFEIFNVQKDGNVKKAKGNVLETVGLTINLDDSLLIKNENFYYEHYGNEKALIDKIKYSFNKTINISDYSIGKIKESYRHYLEVYNKQNNTDYSLEVDKKALVIEVIYEEKIHEFIINLLSSSNKEIQSNYVISLYEMTKNIPKLAFNVLTNNLEGKIVEDVLYKELDIYELVNVSPAQNIEITIEPNKVIIPSLNYSNEAYKTRTVEYTIRDLTLNETYTYNRIIAFYNSNFINNSMGEIKVEYNDNYVCSLNSTFHIERYVNKVYYELSFNSVKYRDYLDYTYYLEKEVETKEVGKQAVSIVVKNKQGETTVEYSEIEIIDDYPPIILTQYNFVVVKKNDFSYLSQIKIIDNNSVDETKTSYTLVKKSETDEKLAADGYIIVNAFDKNGLETTEKLLFVYEQKETFYQKTIGKWLYKWGNFLKDVF